MKILFLHNNLSTFVKSDLEILQAVHEVRPVWVHGHDPLRLASDLWQSINGVLWADVIFAWFGVYHAALPFTLGRLSGRKCVVIASGYDVANMPEIDYGNMRPGLRRIIGRWVFRLSDRVLAVSKFSAGEAVRNALVPPNKVQVIYHGLGVFAQEADPQPSISRSGVLTVGKVERKNLQVKGLLTFIEAARLLPAIPFTVIGPWVGDAAIKLKVLAPENVQIIGPVYGEDLFHHMQRSKVYVQISAYESFGMSLAEAMLCGCIPVITNRGALPEVAGNNGYRVDYGDANATANAIRAALSTDESIERNCQEWIRMQFPLEKRKQQLLTIIDQLA